MKICIGTEQVLVVRFDLGKLVSILFRKERIDSHIGGRDDGFAFDIGEVDH